MKLYEIEQTYLDFLDAVDNGDITDTRKCINFFPPKEKEPTPADTEMSSPKET